MSAQPKAKTEAAENSASVEQIRDILFGAQMQQYERRFQELEARLTQSLDALRQEMTRRLDALSDDLAEERKVREKADGDLYRQFEQKEQTLYERIDKERAEQQAALESEAARLRDSKADRSLLTEILRQAAAQVEDGRPTAPPPSE